MFILVRVFDNLYFHMKFGGQKRSSRHFGFYAQKFGVGTFVAHTHGGLFANPPIWHQAKSRPAAAPSEIDIDIYLYLDLDIDIDIYIYLYLDLDLDIDIYIYLYLDLDIDITFYPFICCGYLTLHVLATCNEHRGADIFLT